jgi:hypothetical protein
MPTNPAKAREDKLRRMAERQGLRLVKSGRRDPLALGYGKFALFKNDTKPHPGAQFSLTIDDVENLLKGVTIK